MAESKKKVSKKAASKKKVVSRKKTASKKKVTARNSSPPEEKLDAATRKRAAARKKATASRRALTDKMKSDFQASKNTLKFAGIAAKENAYLLKAVAESEFAARKGQVVAIINHSNSPIRTVPQQTRKILSASEMWGKRQLSKAKQAAEGILKKIRK